jgi:LPS export ABC transporter protein LptC
MWGTRRTSPWVWLSAALIAILLGSGISRTLLAAQSTGPAAVPPQIALQKVHMIETREGAKLWELQADQVEVNEREGITVLTRVTQPIQIAFFSNQGQVTCVANRATLDLKTKDVHLQGAVWARSEQGMELRTEALTWTAISRRLHTDQAVTITRGTLVSQGRGMEAETDLERVRLFKNITSQVGPARIPTGRSRSR